MGREKDTHIYLPHMRNKTLEDTYKASNWLFMRMGDKGSGKILHCMFFISYILCLNHVTVLPIQKIVNLRIKRPLQGMPV